MTISRVFPVFSIAFAVIYIASVEYNLALFTYFIPAAFLAVPMYKTMGMYGLLNNDFAIPCWSRVKLRRSTS